MYDVVNGVSPEIMKEVFKFRGGSRYILRRQNTFICPIVNTVYNGTETVLFMGPKIWELIPAQIKELISLNGFKKAVKKWKPVNCPFLADFKNLTYTMFVSHLNDAFRPKSKFYLNLYSIFVHCFLISFTLVLFILVL